MVHITLSTRNAHKTREFQAMLGDGFRVVDLTDAGDVPAVEETGTTFQENAALKAIAASRVRSGLVIADDSGLEVDALGGAPGVYSARYAGSGATDAENVAKLLTQLHQQRTDNPQRSARFVCAIAVARDAHVLKTVVGTVDGEIAAAPRGEVGFGYDPVFVPRGFARTFAELGESVKNAISHRAAAVNQLRDYLAQVDA